MKRPDPVFYILLGATLALITLGILILASVSAPFSQESFGSPYYFLNHQLLFGLIPGLILGFLVFKLNLTLLKKWSLPLLFINMVFLAAVFLPQIGMSSGGAARWLNLGSFSFQPSEFLKLTFILYLASWLINRRALIAFLIVIGLISLLLVFQPDISTLGIVLLTAGVMYFLAQTPFWHILLILLLGGGGLLALIKFASYRVNRLLVFFNPTVDPMGMGYQMKQALIAVGSGGILGLGLGMSNQKFGFLPQPMSDSIFAVFAEETGFVGGLILVLLFLLFLWAGFKIGKSSQDKFYQLTGLGITFWIVIQGFINIGSIIGVLPLTGIPLPFISYGGSAIITELAGVGILLNIAKSSKYLNI